MSDVRAWGRIGGLTAWAQNEPEVMVGPAHRGFRRRFENQVVAAAAVQGRTLTPEEIAVRSDRARRAYMLVLAAKSAAARKKAAPGRVTTPGAAATRTDHDAAST